MLAIDGQRRLVSEIVHDGIDPVPICAEQPAVIQLRRPLRPMRLLAQPSLIGVDPRANTRMAVRIGTMPCRLPMVNAGIVGPSVRPVTLFGGTPTRSSKNTDECGRSAAPRFCTSG